MKKLVIVNGSMGVGKSAVCEKLYKRLNTSVWLDGDWCWMMNPFTVTDENINMVQNNIISLLNSFLHNSSFRYVIFSWVIHLEEIFDTILGDIDTEEYDLYKFTLMCSEETLRRRILGRAGGTVESADRSIARLALYEKMDTVKIDTTDLSPELAAERIIEIIG